ncbi:FAD-dependent oxidoreductase, partial [Streptomyces sp. NPDC058674]|uniref:FAD-dependent oxidoreductase n=1 Tax=Streptomyces sp. NPDC058674 TaxID=3346592 RepID=UPI0036597220
MNAPATTADLPTVVIGAGPVGLAAAAHLTARGLTPLVLEAGPRAGTATRDWAHVRLFSTWSEVVDPAAEKLLAPTGWTAPDGATYPSGGDWAELYLQPLADVLGAKVRDRVFRPDPGPHRAADARRLARSARGGCVDRP